MIDAAIVIVNWNGKKYLKDCLDSLAGQIYKNFKIIFVDNGSNDDSIDFVEKNYLANIFSSRLEIIKLKKNTGFAKGYNIGLRKALEDENIKYAIALNNDTKLDEKYVEEAVSCVKNHPDAGSIQPKVLNFFEKSKIDCTGIILKKDGTAHNRGHSEIDKGQYDSEEEIFGANAAAVLFAREALEKTQIKEGEFFDNSHFAFYEDVDLAWRMRLAGFSAYLCPKAIVWHVHSATAGKSSLFKAYYLHRNYFFTVIKNYPFGIMMKTFVWRFFAYIWLVFSVFKKKKRETEFMGSGSKRRVATTILRAWGSVIMNVPSLLKKRHTIQKNKKISSGEIRSWLKKYRAV